MATITTRASKGSALTHNELDQNLINLNDAKLEKNILTTNHSVFVRDSGGNLVQVVIGEGKILGRLTGEEVKAMTVSEVRTLLGIGADMLAIEALSPSDDDILIYDSGAWTKTDMAGLKSKLSIKKSDLVDRVRFAGNYDGGGGTVISASDTWTLANLGGETVEILTGFDHASGRITFNQSTGKLIRFHWSAKATVNGPFDTKHIAAEWRIFDDGDSYQYSVGQCELTIDPNGAAAGHATLSACGARDMGEDWYAELYVKNLGSTDDITLSDISIIAEEL